MRIDTSQHMRLDQRMKLAPRMIQSMEILQMAQQALEERIEQELASNPTLELSDAGDDEADIREELKQAQRDDNESQRELVVSDDAQSKNTADDFERLSNMSEQYGESWDTNTYGSSDNFTRSHAARDNGERDGKMDAMANTAARAESLYDQLIAQWHMVETIPAIAQTGEFLIGFIDADGYLRTEREALLDQIHPDIPPETAEQNLDDALDLLQQMLEPPGMAGRDLRECLLLQIDAKCRQDPDADLTIERTLVSDFLKDIEANRLPKIAKATGLSVAQINTSIHSLRQFHPHPGRQLADDPPHTIRPDALIEFDEDLDSYVAQLTNGQMPALHISAAYKTMTKDKSVEKKTREFVGNNIRSATWLIEAIAQRSATLLRVINVVLGAQRDFFDQGPSALKPLPMTVVADQLGIHVATVSRAVHEKYLQTPRGIFPLRMFFSGGTETQSGDAMSWAAVQEKLKQIIGEEDKAKPLSDDALVEMLKASGIELARRTVAKYRKQMSIPPARQRRQY